MYRATEDFPRPSPVFTPDLDGLIKWLETQDPAKKYNLHHAEQCLWGQFHKAIGAPSIISFGGCDGLDAKYHHAYIIARGTPRTLGAALTRARAAQAAGKG